jgi:hypothetical protein
MVIVVAEGAGTGVRDNLVKTEAKDSKKSKEEEVI